VAPQRPKAEQRALPGKALPKLDFLRKGTRLPTGTATARPASDSARVRSGDRIADEKDIRDWLGGFTKVAASEESVGLGGYGKVLTILVSSSVGQDDEPNEDDDEDELIESWTPRFREVVPPAFAQADSEDR